MTYTRSVCVYCGASRNALEKEAYVKGAQALGRIFVEENIRLVYGGGQTGLMGVIADSVVDHGGHVLGIITEHLHGIEVGHNRINELRIVDTMHERKTMMFDESDAFVILPGGFGTLDELCEIITWKQIGLHDKPIALLDLEQYWSPLFEKFARHMIKEQFIQERYLNFYQIIDEPEAVRSFLRTLPVTAAQEEQLKAYPF